VAADVIRDARTVGGWPAQGIIWNLLLTYAGIERMF
jgi:hypothetical protein